MLQVISSLTHNIRFKKLARDKHSSLICKFVSDEEKKIHNIYYRPANSLLGFFSLTHKYKKRLERPATDKLSSLFCFVISERVMFQNIYFYSTNVIKHF